ncbi:MAG: ParB/RepB/Spo0J family partition protein [Pseudomonadota bacterium]
MAKKRKGLGGLGVDILLSTPKKDAPVKKEKAEISSSGLEYIAVDLVDRSPYQPRQTIAQEGLTELAESIRTQGLIQPIIVRKQGKRYELIAGERRWRAAQLAELHEVPAVIKQADEKAAAAMALVENLQREDLNPIEEAQAVANLIEHFDWTHQEVANAVGKARATVSNLLRLLELSRDVQKLIRSDKISMGHARALHSLSDSQQKKLADQITMKDLSVRQTELMVKKELASKIKSSQSQESNKDPNIQGLENNLADKLGAAVNIKHSQKQKGRIEITYSNLDELDGILRKIGLTLD